MSILKDKLFEDVRRKIETTIYGIAINPEIFKNIALGEDYLERPYYSDSEGSKEGKREEILIPVAFINPYGIRFVIKWKNSSPYSIDYYKGKYYFLYKGNELYPIEFQTRPRYYKLKASDGTDFSKICVYEYDGGTVVPYSNECALFDKGLQCKFCAWNTTHSKKIQMMRNPQQVAEAVSAAFNDCANRVVLTGGFIPERRELEYYVDVAEAIQKKTGRKDFGGQAVIGAPADLEMIDQYRDAGYSRLAIDIEIWDRNIFKTICPGKERECGGWEHWVKALEHAAEVFGFGNVSSNIVSGIEPKDSTLNGVEYLASKGIICMAGIWEPRRGSELEGHCTPEPEWHLDMAYKVSSIYRRYGFTYEHLYTIFGHPALTYHDIYNIEDERLPIFKKENEVLI